MKINSIPLVIREREWKLPWDTVTHLLEWKTKLKRADNTKQWRGCGIIGTLTHG